MSALAILIGFSIMIALFFLIAFLISVKAGQFDDTYTPAIRMLFEDKPEAGDMEHSPETEDQENQD